MSALVALAYIARTLAHGGESTWWREHGREGAAVMPAHARGAAAVGSGVFVGGGCGEGGAAGGPLHRASAVVERCGVRVSARVWARR